MRNLSLRVEGSHLIITCDLQGGHKLSATGKTQVIASTEGNVSIPGSPDTKVGVNLYTKV